MRNLLICLMILIPTTAMALTVEQEIQLLTNDRDTAQARLNALVTKNEIDKAQQKLDATILEIQSIKQEVVDESIYLPAVDVAIY